MKRAPRKSGLTSSTATFTLSSSTKIPPRPPLPKNHEYRKVYPCILLPNTLVPYGVDEYVPVLALISKENEEEKGNNTRNHPSITQQPEKPPHAKKLEGYATSNTQDLFGFTEKLAFFRTELFQSDFLFDGPLLGLLCRDRRDTRQGWQG